MAWERLMAAMSELDIGGSASAAAEAALGWEWAEGRRSRATEKERSRARNWMRGGTAEAEDGAKVRERAQASRRVEEGRARRAEMAWREVV